MLVRSKLSRLRLCRLCVYLLGLPVTWVVRSSLPLVTFHMPLLANIVGFSLVGLAARFGQLGIQKQNLFKSMYLFCISWLTSYPAIDPGGHLLSMGVFGFAGYWAYKWDIRSNELLVEKRQEILERRQKQMQKIDQGTALAES